MTSKRIDNYGKINRNRVVSFTWNQKKYFGFDGDSLASAMLANDIKIVGRSFKYHRPRGIMSCGVEESGALVTIGQEEKRDPNVRATTQELYEGLVASGQNAYPNVNFDLGAVSGLLGRFFAAGFYYKTFIGLPPFEWGKGTKAWMFYEKIIRRAAGMGIASRLPDPDTYEHANDFCDVMVIGSGPAGIAAAQEAADKKLDVILVEQDSVIGGDKLSDADFDSENLRSSLISSGVKIMTRTTAFGLYDNCVAGLLERVTDHTNIKPEYLPRQRFWTIRAKHIIIGTGAFERHIAFNNNDVPGVMNANAAKHYLNRYGVVSGQNITLATNNDSVYVTALELAQAGSNVSIIDSRSSVGNEITEELNKNNIELILGRVPYNINGKKSVHNIELINSNLENSNHTHQVNSDLVLLSGGWSPVVHLLSHRGVKPKWDNENLCFVPDEIKEPITVAGSASGIWGTGDCVASGVAAGLNAAKSLGLKTTDYFFPKRGGWKNPIQPLYEIKYKKNRSKSFIDYQHDVTCDDVRLAHREGFVSVEHLKRYTTLGMANDQGKMGNIIGLAVMAELLNKKIPEVGTTVFRPPYTPVAIGALAGRNVGKHFRALRVTPMHKWNLDNGAQMIETGLYQRPWYYPMEGETLSDSYIREATTVRKTVGICDVTSLGKIAIQGPDSTEFLNRVYSNAFAKLAIGKVRYGIMLRDDGIVMDDGTSWRLSENDYFMTTSTAQAAKVMAWLEELLQTRWSDLKVHVASVSEQWAGAAVAGPESRKTLIECLEDPQVISNDNLPFMGVISTNLKNGIPCRIARISFSGEMAYEVYTASDYAPDMMDILWKSAQNFKGCLYGLEALGALRIEKGHVTGAELDGRVTIDDAGLGKMASVKKSYIGSAMRSRGVLSDKGREILVGLFPKNKNEKFEAGTILCESGKVNGFGIGRITAVTHSPALGHWIGLGFVKGGVNNWKNKEIIGSDPVRNNEVRIEVVSPHMYDPDGEKMHG